MKRADPEKNFVPCLLCEQDIQMICPRHTLKDIEEASFDRGVECRTYGNYGSQVWDTYGTIFFAICDGCLVKHSHKLLLKEPDKPDNLDKPEIKNAQDYYLEWFKWLSECGAYKVGDRYFDDVSPYFRNLDQQKDDKNGDDGIAGQITS